MRAPRSSSTPPETCSRRRHTLFDGRPPAVGPGVTWTLRLPREGEQVADRDAPVGLACHVLDDGARLTSHFRTVG
jgi:Icc protein